MKTNFWGSGNHGFSIFLDSSQLLPVEAVSHLTRTYWKRGNEAFVSFFVYCCIPSFCMQVETIIEIRGKSIF